MQPAFQKLSPPPGSSLIHFVRDDPRFEFYWHYHPEFELTLIIDSRGRRFVGDHIGDYDEGDLVLLGPSLPHTWYSGSGTRQRARHRAVVIQFHLDVLQQAGIGLPEGRRISRMLEMASCGLQFTGGISGTLGPRMMEFANASGMRRLIALLDLLDQLSRWTKVVPLASKEYRPHRPPTQRHRFDQICTYLNEHFTDNVELSKVSAMAGVSPSSFCRLFRRTTRKTLRQYLNELRVGHACRLLRESERSVVDICFACGFGNLANFNRRFRKINRMAPRDYRRQFALSD